LVEAAGISAGVIAAIVIASAVGFAIFVYSGRKGIQMLMRKKSDMGAIQDNPLYSGNKSNFENQLYVAKE